MKGRALVAGLAVLATTTAAQERRAPRDTVRRSDLHGPWVAGAAAVTSVTSDDAAVYETEYGSGYDLRAGWFLRRRWAPFVGFTRSVQRPLGDGDDLEDYVVQQADVGLRIAFRDGRRWVPYFDFVASRREASSRVVVIPGEFEPEVVLAGWSGGFGGGITLFVAPRVGLDLGANWNWGRFPEVTVDGAPVTGTDTDFPTTSLRVRIAVTILPFARR